MVPINANCIKEFFSNSFPYSLHFKFIRKVGWFCSECYLTENLIILLILRKLINLWNDHFSPDRAPILLFSYCFSLNETK